MNEDKLDTFILNQIKDQTFRSSQWMDLLKYIPHRHPLLITPDEIIDYVTSLKSTLEEIKEKITIKMARYFHEKDYCIEDTDLDELLQIIDKGVNNE